AGLGILRTLLADEAVTHVTVLARRPFPSWVVLPGGTPAKSPKDSPMHPKLSTSVLSSFHTYPSDVLKEHEACIWALGKSQRGMTEGDYTEMTVGFVDSFLEAAKEIGVGSKEKPFRFIFISGRHADSAEKSSLLFARVKGKAENHLIKHAEQSNGAFETTILRPGGFFPSRAYPADARNTRSTFERTLSTALGPLLPSSWVITVEQIGVFSLEAVKGTWNGTGKTVFENAEMKRMVDELGKR
ncbi:hypothetical protein K488DRAFT_41616, partial [Vararia minispora EC-137]